MYTYIFIGISMYLCVCVCMLQYSYFMPSGLRIFRTASASLSWNAVCIQPGNQPVLVWTRQPDFQDADPHRRWSHQGVPVCTHRDLVRLLPGTGETVVAQHCPDWNQARLPAITRACRVCCSPLSHSGQTAPDSGRRPRHHSPQHARPQGCVL